MGPLIKLIIKLAAKIFRRVPKKVPRTNPAKKAGQKFPKEKPCAKKNCSNSQKIAIDDKRKKHIFRKAEGHLEDTPSNRKMLEDVANNSENALGTDKWGNTWSAKVQSDGSQVWTQSRGGQIINGGVNQTPRPFNRETGLSSPIKPVGE